MEDNRGMFIYLMVHNFEQVAGAVNAKPQIGVCTVFFPGVPVIVVILEGVKNVLPAKGVLERSFVKLNNNLPIHTSMLSQNLSGGKAYPVYKPRRPNKKSIA